MRLATLILALVPLTLAAAAEEPECDCVPALPEDVYAILSVEGELGEDYFTYDVENRRFCWALDEIVNQPECARAWRE